MNEKQERHCSGVESREELHVTLHTVDTIHLTLPPGPAPHLQGVVGEAGVVAGPGAGLPPPHPVPPALTLPHLHLYTQDNC